MAESSNTINITLGSVANDIYDYTNTILSNPSIMIVLVVVVILYIIIFSGGNSQQTDSVSNSSSNIISTIFISFFVILVLINGFQYFFGIDIISKLKHLLISTPEIVTPHLPEEEKKQEREKEREKEQLDVSQLLNKKQVFNISENDFVYSDAKALCKAYGARLATYTEVEDSYKDGAEWCNYGWSDGQMALFPTQQSTFDKLQTIEGHKNDCGRPGINGGYMANPELRFGVNCYGVKPRMTPLEEDLMATKPIYPKTLKDKAMEDRVNYWKNKLSEILVSPFNHNSWSRI